MNFKKTIRLLHLWLGLGSGLIILIVALTGCLYAFKEEIENLTQPFRFVKVENKSFLAPSEIARIAQNVLPGKELHSVMFLQRYQSAKAIFYHEVPDEYYFFVYLNPYTGEVLKINDERSGFFPFILSGHFNLWLPQKVGKTVVAASTLLFFVMAISGLILWWPKNRRVSGQRFSIKWKAGWRRKNFDLHGVLGFYSLWIGVIFSITGLVWGFQWFLDGYYYTISGGEKFKPYQAPVSAATTSSPSSVPAIDRVYSMMTEKFPMAESIEVHPPHHENDCIAANANPDQSTYWKVDYRYFDRYTLQELTVDHVWGNFERSSAAEKLMRMNYDIHVGAIGGLAGKILAFLASLTIASLPVTGFLLWWGRRNKSKEEQQQVPYASKKKKREPEFA